MTEIIGWTVTIIAITGVVLNNHRRRACFAVWMVSNLLSAGLHIHAGMTALAVRDAIFFILAIHGLICWSKIPRQCRGLTNKPPAPLGDYTTLAEGKIKRGGIKPPPTHSKPKIRPKPQRTQRNDK
ncbi:MAG: nicotinamide mononucleotide transporter [Phycisphaerae bacterium]|nr:nicotinamide mononucleotide transporter [Phycisphaerae bacterium]